MFVFSSVCLQYPSVNNQSYEIERYEGIGISPFAPTQNSISLTVGALKAHTDLYNRTKSRTAAEIHSIIYYLLIFRFGLWCFLEGDLYSAAALDTDGNSLQFRRNAGRRANLWMYDSWVSGG